jgi:hypothetical protein
MFVQEIKAYAVENYDTAGWDFIVETYTDEDILALIKDCISFQEAIDTMLEHIRPLSEFRSEIISSEF